MTGTGESATTRIGVRPYRLSRAEVERRGRWASYRRAFLLFALLWLLQLPPWMVAQGHWPSTYGLDAAVPARIALMVDFAMIPAYVTVAFRASELITSAKAPAIFQRVARISLWLVCFGGVLDVLENAVLWVRVADYLGPAALTLAITYPMRAAVGGGLVVLALAALLSSPGLWWVRRGDTAQPRPWLDGLRKGPVSPWLSFLDRAAPSSAVDTWRRVLESHEQPPPAPAEPNGTVICCSGGGIRSASFCLGGLQVLTDHNVYQRADAVVGVSGGGYVAAAYHVLRWRSRSADDAAAGKQGETNWVDLTPAAYSRSSPELVWLRRHTRYLFESARVATLGLLSLLLGIAVNLVLLGAFLVGAAWLLGWFLLASGGMRDFGERDAVGAAYAGAWTWVDNVWVVPLAGVAMFVFERVTERFWTWPHRLRETWRSLAVYVIWSGAAIALVLIGLPRLLAWTHDWAAASPSAVAGLVHAIGLVPDSACVADLGCGQPVVAVDPTSSTPVVVSVATVVSAIVAVAKAAKANMKSEVSLGPGLRSLTARLWARTRDIVVPWVASAVIVLAVVVLVLRWTVARIVDPGLLSQWTIAYGFLASIFAIKVCTDANRTSLHYFYRERLSYAFFVRRNGSRIEPLPYRERLRFSESAPPPQRGPRLVTCAVANVSDVEYVPADRNCTPFVFDQDGIGLTDAALPAGADLCSSPIYERAADSRARDVTVTAAMAISGAAFSPLAGRQSIRIGPYRAVLALGNARLGVWLPNPLWIDELTVLRRLIARRESEATGIWDRLRGEQQVELYDRLRPSDRRWLSHRLPSSAARSAPTEEQIALAASMHRSIPTRRFWYARADALRDAFAKPGAFRVAKEAFGRTSVLDRRLYVTDGGHYDNLGLVEALRRRPREVYVLDASSDPEDSFRALGEAIATARIDLDVEVHFDPRSMRRVKEGRAKAAWGTGTAVYPDGSAATIHVVKVVMLDNLPWDTEAYAAGHPTFPRTNTGDQLYGEFDLEAYRVLGREVTHRLLTRPRARREEAKSTASGVVGAQRTRNGVHSRPPGTGVAAQRSRPIKQP